MTMNRLIVEEILDASQLRAQVDSRRIQELQSMLDKQKELASVPKIHQQSNGSSDAIALQGARREISRLRKEV